MSKYRALIVEDDPDMQIVLKNFLHEEYEVVVADNGLDALLNLRRIEPDFIVLDVMMPVMDGLEFARRIRAHPFELKIPVIMLSALVEHHEIAQGKQSGADTYLAKPVEPERLQRVVRTQLLEHRQPHRVKKHEISVLESLLAAQAENTAARTSPDHGKHLALIVSSDQDLRDQLVEALCGQYEIYTATNGLQAIDRMIEHPPDFFVIDFAIPRVSGIEFVQLLRRTSRHFRTPVLFILDQNAPAELEQIKQLPHCRHLVKPIDSGEVLKLADLKMQP